MIKARRLRAQRVQHGVGQCEVIAGTVNADVAAGMNRQVAEHRHSLYRCQRLFANQATLPGHPGQAPPAQHAMGRHIGANEHLGQGLTLGQVWESIEAIVPRRQLRKAVNAVSDMVPPPGSDANAEVRGPVRGRAPPPQAGLFRYLVIRLVQDLGL